VSTSVAYLSKRLADIGRHDLLEGAQRGEFSYLAAAEWAGLVTRRPPTGNGSQNAAKRRAWALMRTERASGVSRERANLSQPHTAMPDLAAAITEWEEAQKPAPREPEPAPVAPPPEPERSPFPAHPAIPCTRCEHPQAAAALREILNGYVAATRGELHPTGSTLPRACCQWSCRRPDIRAMIA
jgi:hypothetical protein